MTVIFPVVTGDQKAVLGVAITFAILPVVAVCLRLLARKIAHRKLDLSDYFIIVAMVLAVALEAVSITGVIQGGIGFGHMLDIVAVYGMGPVTKLQKLVIPLQILWALSLSFSKISVLLLCVKVFDVPAVKYAAWGIMGLISVWCIGTILAGLLICQPIAMNWNPTGFPDGSCGDQVLSFTITGVVNLITDVAVLALPMPYLYKLQLPLYKKIVLISVFSVGFLTCIISGFRIHTLASMDFEDITFSIPLANIFSGLEPSIAVVLACVPLLRPLFGRSKYSDSGTAHYVDNSGLSKSGERNIQQGRQFEPLSDDSSQYRLRPLGNKHEVDVSASERPMPPGSSDSDRENGGITVKQEWKISGDQPRR